METEAAPPKRRKVSVAFVVGLLIAFLVVVAIAIPNLLAAKMSSGETAPIATLRNLASCQGQIQTGGGIDVDGDGIGEYGTFLEMAGSAPARQSADGATRGKVVSPPLLGSAFAGVDADGIVTKSGYCFRIHLPDTASPTARWVHERGPASAPGFAGGTGRVHTDLAETMWCAYAWPGEKSSETRVFFVNQAGDVLISRNEVAKWRGLGRAPPPDSAFLGNGITSPNAVGTRGRDGEFWRPAN